jgi:hypothetical protein
MNKIAVYCTLCIIICITLAGRISAQQNTSLTTHDIEIYQGGYLRSVEKKLEKFDHQLAKSLKRFKKAFDRSGEQLDRRMILLLDPSSGNVPQMLWSSGNQDKADNHLPYIDTLEATLSFLERIDVGRDHLSKVFLLQNRILLRSVRLKLDGIVQLKKVLAIKAATLHQLTQEYRSQVTGFLQSINKELYCFNQSVDQYKGLLCSHSKNENRLMEVLRHYGAFLSFIDKNKFIALLFHSSPVLRPG